MTTRVATLGLGSLPSCCHWNLAVAQSVTATLSLIVSFVKVCSYAVVLLALFSA